MLFFHVLKKELNLVVDWSKVDKTDYLLAMERSPIKDTEIKELSYEKITIFTILYCAISLCN